MSRKGSKGSKSSFGVPVTTSRGQPRQAYATGRTVAPRSDVLDRTTGDQRRYNEGIARGQGQVVGSAGAKVRKAYGGDYRRLRS